MWRNLGWSPVLASACLKMSSLHLRLSLQEGTGKEINGTSDSNERRLQESDFVPDGPSSQHDEESALPTGLLRTPDPGRSIPVPRGLRARLVRSFRCTDAV